MANIARNSTQNGMGIVYFWNQSQNFTALTLSDLQ